MKKFFLFVLFSCIVFFAQAKVYTSFEMYNALICRIRRFYSDFKTLPQSICELKTDKEDDVCIRLELFRDVSIQGDGKKFVTITFRDRYNEYKLLDEVSDKHLFSIFTNSVYFQHLGEFVYCKEQDVPITGLLIGNNGSTCVSCHGRETFGVIGGS